MTGVTYADGTTQRYAYDSLGNVTQSVDGNGNAVQYTYNQDHLVTSETLADGTEYGFTWYDTHDNLISATDASGTTFFTYDSADRLTKVAYPNGEWLAYTYNAAGQRVQTTTQTGYAVNYQYDALGRLSQLTDANANLIASYGYDAAGRLASQKNGNDTSTIYSYDADGRTTGIANYAPDGSVQSFNDYTYNAQSLPIIMTTVAGTFRYGYDADGQLTSVQTPAGDTITYQYDAAGNRIGVVDNGSPTLYITNNMNEYTSAGDATYEYDAAGNLVSKSDGTGTTTYTYNLLGQLSEVVSPTDGTTTLRIRCPGGVDFQNP